MLFTIRLFFNKLDKRGLQQVPLRMIKTDSSLRARFLSSNAYKKLSFRLLIFHSRIDRSNLFEFKLF